MFRILYVDDEPSLLEIGKLFLEQEGAFAVDTLTSARAALEQLNTERYDAIISDYLMPEMDGITFLKHLKASGNSTPFIIFTGRGREEVVIEALNSGADFYLQKGGEPKSQFTELAHKIRTAVNRQRTEKLAKDTERQLNDIINSPPDATFKRQLDAMATNIPGVVFRFRVNPDGTYGFDYISKRSRQILGLENDAGTFLDKVTEGIVEPDRKGFLSSVRHAVSTKTLWEFECQYVKPSGKTIWISAVSNPIMEQDYLIFDGVVFDNTDRKRAEETLKGSEERFRGLVDTITSGVAIYEVRDDGACGRDYIIKDFNKMALEIEGKTKEEVIGKTLVELRPAIDEFGLIPVFRQVWKTGVPAYFPQKNYVDEKYSRWYENRVFRLHSGEIVAVYDDITERKRTEEALVASEANYRVLLDESSDPIFSFYPDGTYRYVNRAFAEGVGKSVDQIIGKKIWDVFQPDEAEKRFSALRMVFSTGKGKEIEVRVPRPDGDRYYVTTIVPVIDEKGSVVSALCVSKDITERRRVDAALRAANRKLTLLSGITRHDINNQLAVLQGYQDLLGKNQPDLRSNEYFQKVTTAAQRISAMIRFTGEYESIGVNAPIWQDCRSLVDTVAKQASLGKVIVKNDLPDGFEVFTDPLVARVFYNLMDNAVRYGGKITTIRFSSKEHNGASVVVCEDDGFGVSAEEKENIFERGFGKNTGLGLALSREILDITGITIKESGEPGSGARFEIAVPTGSYRIIEVKKNP